MESSSIQQTNIFQATSKHLTNIFFTSSIHLAHLIKISPELINGIGGIKYFRTLAKAQEPAEELVADFYFRIDGEVLITIR